MAVEATDRTLHLRHRPEQGSRSARFKISFCLLATALVACGGGGNSDAVDDAQGTGSTPATSPSPAPGPSPAPSPSPSPAPTPAPPAAATATLQWSASIDSRAVGYRVYYGTSSRNYSQARGSGIDVGASVSRTVGNLTVGKTYYFAVTAYDLAGNESDYSAEASKLIQ